MFYVETTDGEKFFTSTNSDDVEEFARILETKLGKDMSKLFKDILEDKVSSTEIYYTDGDGFYSQIEPYESAISDAVWGIKDILCKGKTTLPKWAIKDLKGIQDTLENHE